MTFEEMKEDVYRKSAHMSRILRGKNRDDAINRHQDEIWTRVRGRVWLRIYSMTRMIAYEL